MPVTDEDRTLALEPANQLERVSVTAGYARANISTAIAKGIALGRKQELDHGAD
jgi:hypothetical protein